MKTLKEKIAVMQAVLDGEEVQFSNHKGEWTDFIERKPIWSWDSHDYRIKPKPMEFWVVIYHNDEAGTIAHKSQESAKRASIGCQDFKTIKVREVIEE